MHQKRWLPLLVAGAVFLSGCGKQPLGDPVETALDESGKNQSVTITVDHAYEPNHIVAKAGVPLVLNFHRLEKNGSCAKKLEIPALDVSMTLPNREITVIEVPPQPTGTEIPFRCSMDMMRGKIVFE